MNVLAKRVNHENTRQTDRHAALCTFSIACSGVCTSFLTNHCMATGTRRDPASVTIATLRENYIQISSQGQLWEQYRENQTWRGNISHVCFEPSSQQTQKSAPPFPRRCLVYVNDGGLLASRVSFETAPLNCLSGETRALRWAKVGWDGVVK